ncbi:iron-containing alcohol dehydrogenase family protein [Sporanaerobacter sp. PP17-6a]|uniref:iron-containing alcohol dehydrogenase family protein n=1 Tax=Sporanaerobacter sp. PP17-6a TaxID=1891289 RepID=UPI0008A0053C|nr:iron-containing alcohol dehydrogenase [Sporanaerobacter sp. PP17-6a]SCL94706.1 Alcohol dehydrogenase 2 [Sporanaerobacter sp. PP17-6a]
MKDFNFSVFQNVVFGSGSLKKVPDILKDNGCKKVFIVSGPTLNKIGAVKKLTDLIKESGLEYDVFLDVEPNPSIETVYEATKMYKDSGATNIVALGGGSPMDVSKAVGVLATYGGEITDYEGYEKVPGKIIPIIAIPTTAGTGSEVTRTSVVTDKSRNYKFAVISSTMIPSFAILDPELIMSLSPIVAASTGIDALVHAIESYISLNSNVFTDTMAEKAMELIGKYIRRFVANRKDEEAASAMLIASNFAGIAFTRALLGNVHAMAHPLGGYFNVPHGIANAILLPAVIEYNALTDNGKYEKIYNYIKLSKEQTYNFTPDMLTEEIKSLISSLGIPPNLSEVGVTEDKIREMATDAMKSGNILANPRQSTVEDIEALYRKVL